MPLTECSIRMEARSQHHALRQLMQAVEATMQRQRRAALSREYKQVMLLRSREGKQKSVQEDAEGQRWRELILPS